MTKGRKAAVALALLDVTTIAVVVNVIAWARGILDFNGVILGPLIVPIVTLGIALYLIDAYKLHTDMLSLDYASQHTIAIIAALAANLLIMFVIIPAGYPLQQSRLVVSLSFLALIPCTLVYRRWIFARLKTHADNSCVVFIGDPVSASAFREEWDQAAMKQRLIFATSQTGQTQPGLPASTESMSFPEVLQRMNTGEIQVESIVLRESNRGVTPDVAQQLIELYFNGIPTYTLELFHQVYWRKIPLYRLNQTWLFQEGFRTAREPVFDRLKRMSDLILALGGLIFFSPLMAVIAGAILVDDGGPVFFRQRRIGRHRAPFRVYKFRTMYNGPGGELYAQQDDRRVTRVGRILRQTRLDELPQLVNVLRGEMSLIGPRAEWDRLVADYEQRIPSYHVRHLVRPGITGWAQVNFRYGANLNDTQRKLEYDLYYIRHFSFTLDASIVLKTIHVMLFGKGR